MTAHLSNLHAALADARKARDEALSVWDAETALTWSNGLPSWAARQAQRAAESAARCEGRLLAVIEAMEASGGLDAALAEVERLRGALEAIRDNDCSPETAAALLVDALEGR